MFAFAVHERDRFGIKPLYCAETPHELRFASSLPALIAAGDIDTPIDPAALNFYLSFHAVVPPPRTILSGVRKLPPTTVRAIGPDGRAHERTYWKLSFERSGRRLVDQCGRVARAPV